MAILWHFPYRWKCKSLSFQKLKLNKFCIRSIKIEVIFIGLEKKYACTRRPYIADGKHVIIRAVPPAALACFRTCTIDFETWYLKYLTTCLHEYSTSKICILPRHIKYMFIVCRAQREKKGGEWRERERERRGKGQRSGPTSMRKFLFSFILLLLRRVYFPCLHYVSYMFIFSSSFFATNVPCKIKAKQQQQNVLYATHVKR